MARAELTGMAGYTLRQITCLQLPHCSINWVWTLKCHH